MTRDYGFEWLTIIPLMNLMKIKLCGDIIFSVKTFTKLPFILFYKTFIIYYMQVL